jgi:hypothetical protein
MNKIKFVDVTFSDHTTWRIPAEQIAAARAHYFAEGDAARGDGSYEEVYAQELEYTLGDRAELLDYLENSMDWSDFADTAVLVAAPRYQVEYDREFTNAPKELTWDHEN